jgi:hypothetical protein
MLAVFQILCPTYFVHNFFKNESVLRLSNQQAKKNKGIMLNT